MAIEQVKSVLANPAVKPAIVKPAAVNLLESKADRFYRLADKRLNNALDKIRLIGNLSGAGYESTAEQVDFIESCLSAAVVDVINSLRKVRIAKATFTLPKA
jgi:hypothetical protein